MSSNLNLFVGVLTGKTLTEFNDFISNLQIKVIDPVAAILSRPCSSFRDLILAFSSSSASSTLDFSSLATDLRPPLVSKRPLANGLSRPASPTFSDASLTRGRAASITDSLSSAVTAAAAARSEPPPY
ncbi:hypothetical protein DFJ73DRAFT_796223 [Zopfochytrium polystomum]|nr:hypothetical protein DFJ73DRAFT_796223 [Zopfochytrium polystomum]